MLPLNDESGQYDRLAPGTDIRVQPKADTPAIFIGRDLNLPLIDPQCPRRVDCGELLVGSIVAADLPHRGVQTTRLGGRISYVQASLDRRGEPDNMMSSHQ